MINYALITLKDKLLKTLMTALNSALRKNHEREELFTQSCTSYPLHVHALNRQGLGLGS